MLKQSSPPRLKAQPCKAAQSRALVKHSEETLPMRLEEAARYFSSRLPKVFRVVEEVDSPKGSEGVQLAKGDIFIVCLIKAASFLKLKSGSGWVTIPFDTRTEFALTPLSEEDNETDAAVKSWEGEFHSVTEFLEVRKSQSTPMPAALNVLNNVLDHDRRKVLARTILFNIRQVAQRAGLRKRYGIEAVDYSGLVHRFLEGEDPLHFSTKLFDTRCSPVYFANVLHFPQTARVYLHPSTDREEEEAKLLPNLSTTTITEVTHDHHLVVRKLSDDGNQLGPTFTVPLCACLKVVAIKPKDSALLDSISDQRHIGRATASPTVSLADLYMNPYSDDPTKATRGGIQAGKKVVAIKPKDSALLDSISDQRHIGRATASPNVGPTASLADMNPYSDDPCEATKGNIQAGRKGDEETYYNEVSARRVRHHAYVNVGVPVAFVPAHAPSDLDDNSDVHVFMEGLKVTTGAPHGKVSPYHGNPTQSLAVPCKYWKDGGVASSGHPPATSARTGESHHLLHSNSQKLHSMHNRGIDAHPTELQLFHHVARNLGADWKRFAIYLGFEDARIQQADSKQSFEYKALDILVAWRKGSGNKPKSWATILAALETAELGELAREIEGHIEGGTLYCSINSLG